MPKKLQLIIIYKLLLVAPKITRSPSYRQKNNYRKQLVLQKIGAYFTKKRSNSPLSLRYYSASYPLSIIHTSRSSSLLPIIHIHPYLLANLAAILGTFVAIMAYKIPILGKNACIFAYEQRIITYVLCIIPYNLGISAYE